MTSRFCVVILILTAIFVSPFAGASTFVGNGGNAGDVEWQVTLRQVQMAIAGVEQDPPADELLCSCDETYSNASICDALNSLTIDQRRFCGATLKKQIPQLKPLVRANGAVHVTWTTDSIDVLERGERRAVDAVTDRSRGLVTLNANQYRAMNPSERVFLISHELMHLTKLDGHPLTDEGAIGPFTSDDGSRQLINAVAASLTVEAEEAGAFSRYQSTLNRPQGWKTNWLDLTFSSPSASPDSVYAPHDYSSTAFRYTHYVSGFGLNIEYQHLHGDKSVLSTIKVDENVNTWRGGFSYRFFPFNDALTSLGQSNLVVSADVDLVRGSLNLKDSSNNESSTSQRIGASGAIRYYFPIALGLWASLAESYDSFAGAYTVSGIQIENVQNTFATSIGASYAF